MSFQPEITYDAKSKIWSNPSPVFNYFSSNLSIGEIIFNEMRKYPQLVAQISATEDTVLTNDDIHKSSMRVASFMRNLGLQQSDIVGIIARNTTHLSAVVYACFFNGIAFHSLNVTYNKETLEELLSLTKPKLIFCDGDEYEKVRAATANFNVKIITMRNHPGDSLRIDEVLVTPIEDGFKPARLEKGNEQALAILSSSGTTGIPKAITITNNHIWLCLGYQLTSTDVIYTHSTVDWFSGLSYTINSGVFNAIRVIADNNFDPIRLMQIVEKHKLTVLYLTPSQMPLIVNSEAFLKADFSSLRALRYGGSRYPTQIQQKLRNRFSRDCMRLSYAFTELGAVATSNLYYDKKPNSSGRLLSGMKMKILNEEGNTLGPNEVGEICVNSGQHWPGYYGNPEESRKMFDSDRWFHSGDMGYVDDDGFLYVLDRKTDILKCQGMKYYPYEIENVISEMPDVAEVCVFGVWSDFNGDEPAAAVMKKLGSNLKPQDVVDFVKKHVKVNYKQLHGGVILVEELKRTPNGKTSRRDNKEHFLTVANGK